MVASFGNVDTLSNVPALLVGTREPVSRNITLLSGENRIARHRARQDQRSAPRLRRPNPAAIPATAR